MVAKSEKPAHRLTNSTVYCERARQLPAPSGAPDNRRAHPAARRPPLDRADSRVAHRQYYGVSSNRLNGVGLRSVVAATANHMIGSAPFPIPCSISPMKNASGFNAGVQ